MLSIALLGSAAVAKSWCASPLVAHEWGVHVIDIDAGQASGTPLPSWFYRDTARRSADAVPVWQLPPDSGIRDLPVVQLYTPRTPAPIALEVGFGSDAASAWWPQVDRFLPALVAGSPEAMEGRQALLAARAKRSPMGDNRALGPDPTKQLGWDALMLTEQPSHSLHEAELPWVAELRAVPHALWVDASSGDTPQSDRFVFYEAQTHGAPDIALERAESWSTTRPHYRIRNRSDWTAHDLVVIANGRAWMAPAVPPGATAGFLLDTPLDRKQLEAWLRARWLDAAGPPTEHRWDASDCVMMRDPAIPTEKSAGHRLYGPEIDVLFGVWADRMLSSDGVRLIYREDTAALDARMPLSVYTDMFHFIELNRLGIVVVEGVSL